MKKSDNLFFLCGLMMLIGELWKQWCITFLLSGGVYVWWYLPFQLCSVPMYLLLLLPLVKSTRIRAVFYTFIMDFSLLGGIAVFFDTSGLHYELPALTVFSYVWHIGLIALGIFAGTFRKGDCTLHGFLSGLSVYASGCIIATILNLSLISCGNLNLFYISPYFHMTQRFFTDLSRNWGDTPATIAYISATVLGAFFIHLFWHLLSQNSQKSAPGP